MKSRSLMVLLLMAVLLLPGAVMGGKKELEPGDPCPDDPEFQCACPEGCDRNCFCISNRLQAVTATARYIPPALQALMEAEAAVFGRCAAGTHCPPFTGYVPNNWQPRTPMFVSEHKPVDDRSTLDPADPQWAAKMFHYENAAVFWPQGCSTNAEIDDPCANEADCEASCQQICDTNGGGMSHMQAEIYDHPTNKNCKICQQQCIHGACVVTCCYPADNEIRPHGGK